MHGCLEVTVRGVLQQLADVHDESAGDGRRVDPLVAVGDLQPTLSGLDEQQRQRSTVAVGSHTLFRHRIALARVAHDLDERRRALGEGVVEHVRVGPERLSPGAQQPDADGAERLASG